MSFTIHDSVIVKVRDQAKTIEIINKVFMKQIGVIPTLDIKNLKSPKPSMHNTENCIIQ